MKKLAIGVSVLAVLIIGLIGTTSMAFAISPDGITNGEGHGNDFVCPVIASEAMGMNNPNAAALGEGTYTVVPPTLHANHLNVPDTATNGDGYGAPGDHTGDNAQSMPGDTDYTAIWNGDAPHDP